MRRSRITVLVAVAAVIVAAASVFVVRTLWVGSQTHALRISSRTPSVDGTVAKNEYSYSRDFDHELALYAGRTATTLYLALVANSTGWVGVGVGQRMDGADIFMGYVQDQTVSFQPQRGRGHFHFEAPEREKKTVEAYALAERGGKTTLEVALRASDYITDDQRSLDLIFAMGDDDSFWTHHRYQNSASLMLE